jgi:NADH-quinone oxidoreductase subunit N
MWAPDVYQGSPTLVTALFAIVPKVAIILFLARLLLKTYGMWVMHWQQVVIFVSAASMIVGALGALNQSNIKRLLAYSSIGHVGYLLMGIAAANSDGLNALLTYTIIYTAIGIGMFAILVLLNKEDMTISDLAGMGNKYPFMSLMLALLILSLAGIPPLAGFLAKFYIFSAAIKSNLYALVTIGVLASLVSAYYYLNIIKAMYFMNNEMRISLIPSKMLYILIAVMVLANALYVVKPGSLYYITAGASKIFLQTVALLRKRGHDCTVALSSMGPLQEELEKHGSKVQIINLGILRRQYFNPIGIINRFIKLRNASKQLSAIIQ